MNRRLIHLVFLLVAWHTGVAATEATLSLPPASLGQWYKPVAKRQVWLHTMFRLRREMQAVGWYATREERERLVKWSDRLARDYRSIGEMVPEWADELELEWLQRLRQAAGIGDYETVGKALRRIGTSCSGCHREYRAVTALLYRTPDFGRVTVEDSETLEEVPYRDAMGRLSTLVNRIKIASDDGDRETALAALAELRRRMGDLGEGCGGCHRDPAPRERILGDASRRQLDALEAGIDAGDTKQTGRALGTLAVESCARCHGVHRTLNAIRGEIAGAAVQE